MLMNKKIFFEELGLEEEGSEDVESVMAMVVTVKCPNLYHLEKVHMKVLCLVMILPSTKILDCNDLLHFDLGSFVKTC